MSTADYLRRYRDLAVLLGKYGRDFNIRIDDRPPSDRNREPDGETMHRAQEFATKLRELGPTFVKFGQLLSTRPDLLPPEYLSTLEELQDRVGPFPFDEVKSTIERELKVSTSRAFLSIDPEPLASASLGQVHRAVLADGREVVVKVRRPGVRETIAQDMDVFSQIATLLESRSEVARRLNLGSVVRDSRWTMMSELNYLAEARNQIALNRNLAEFEDIYIPSVVESMTSEGVLTSELIRGVKISSLTALDTIEHDYRHLATTLVHAYLKQVCADGFWHADPHPGNVFISGDKLVLLDFGMVGRIGRGMQDLIVRLLFDLARVRGERVAETLIRIGTVGDDFDRQKFIHDISTVVTRYIGAPLPSQQPNAGRLLFRVISIANGNALQMPSELAMLAKTLLQIDDVARTLDPQYDARQTMSSYAESLVMKLLRSRLHPGEFYTSLLDLNELAAELPGRAKQSVEQLATGKLTFNMKLIQMDEILKAFHRLANRIAAGTIIGALILGSAIIMYIPSNLRIFGYPLLAMLGFAGASVLGLYLVLVILRHDRRDRSEARSKVK
ncbi:MAG: AarF/UbiB family protein [Thermoanaerobaculia bacterium]